MEDSERRIVVFDVDGVIADFVWGFSGIAHDLFGYDHINNEKQKHWDWFIGCGYTKEQQDKIWEIVDSTGSTFWEDLPCLATNQDIYSLNMLAEEEEFRVMYCTNRFGVDVKGQTERFLKNNGLPYDDVVISKNKVETLNPIKRKIVGVIDDRPSLLEEFHDEGYPVWARDWQYNRNLKTYIHRVSNITDFCQAMWERTFQYA